MDRIILNIKLPYIYEHIGKAVGFVVWLCINSYSIGKVVILDIRSFVFQGIIDITKWGGGGEFLVLL